MKNYMEGNLLFYRGIFKGYKQSFALMEAECNSFAVFKKVAYEDEKLRINLVKSPVAMEMSEARQAEDSKDTGSDRSSLDQSMSGDNPGMNLTQSQVFPNTKVPNGFMISCKYAGDNNRVKSTIFYFRAES